MTTARGIITKALQKIGALTKSESPSADEISDGLDALNMMVSSWANDSLLVYARAWETFSLTGNQASYTMGTGGVFNTSRPVSIISAYVRIGTTDYALEPIDDQTYVNYIQQKATGGIPQFYTNDNAMPLVTIRLWPVPSASYSIFLLSEKALTAFDIDTVILLPPGWERALVYNLANEIAPEYGQPADQSVFKIADDSLRAIKQSVARNKSMDKPPMNILGTNNIYTGWTS